MAKPLSMDLRERAVSAVVDEGMSCHKAASRFGIGVSTVIAWVRRFRETGSVAPGQMGGYKPKAIRDEHELWLRQRLGEGEFTLRGLVAELAARGLMASFGAVYRFVHAEKLSFKKNRARQRTGSPRRRAPAGAVAGLSEPD
jgi:putative transposase